jgi:glycosyltransferase involved in cell wall biosynthesis
MIRILHLVSTLSKGSGVMSLIMNYYRHIDRSKIQFDFCFFIDENETYDEEIINLGGKIYKISRPSLKKSFKNKVKNFFEEQKGIYTTLHIHEVYLTFLFAPIAKNSGIYNIITHSHSTKFSDNKISALRNRLLCVRINKHANHFFACSTMAGISLYGKKMMKEGKVIIINNAIDCEKFKYDEPTRNKIRKELNLEDNFVIGHIGRFKEQKNHKFLIDVFSVIKKQNKKAKLLLVGEGPLFNQTLENIKQLNLIDDVLFLKQRNDVSKILQTMDAFILPSLFEGLGIVLLEAQSAGLPCYASNVVPIEAKVTDEFHYLSLKEQPRVWANVVLNSVENINRSNSYIKVKNRGFDIFEEVIRLEKIYLSINLNEL